MGKLVLDGHKLEWHKERVEAWKRGERIAPIEIEMALTRACTFRCVYCYGQLQTNDIKKMTWPVIKQFLEDAAEVGVKAINFTGDGESTCSPSFAKAVHYTKLLGMDVAAGTNGYKISSLELPNLLKALTYIRFNISAADPERYCKIHGVRINSYIRVLETIARSVRIKRAQDLPVTIGLQMVFMPEFKDQVIPLTKLGKELGVDYLVIKHCSDDEFGTLGVKYTDYAYFTDLLTEAESYSTDTYKVVPKWSKILSSGKSYSKCYGAPFLMQISGSGLVAPCGMLFNDRYKEKFHIGNIAETRFKDLFYSDRYWEVMDYIVSDDFDAKTMCGSLCLQHNCNEHLYKIFEEGLPVKEPTGPLPQHINFV
ncbi:hypothetical protein LCGC14_1282490 [marine sediment metagenome]|uniref:Radical SAM core domain-containing protein n=1 Tax=marine sediment metagenome TaxID=412755 RepID=A0A0F9KWI7_9ZZZZ